ncbi:hypothetical protein K9N50_09525 [bacterium]|nr:hypothetical protein [bacterium]
MYRRILIIALLAVSFFAANATPTYNDNSLGFKDWLGNSGMSTDGLIDPSRLTVQHNVSFGFATGNGQSLTQSLYTATFGYRLSDPLTLSFLMGYQDSRLAGQSIYPNNFNSMIGGVALDWRPTHNFQMRIELIQAPGLYLNNGLNNAGQFRRLSE